MLARHRHCRPPPLRISAAALRHTLEGCSLVTSCTTLGVHSLQNVLTQSTTSTSPLHNHYCHILKRFTILHWINFLTFCLMQFTNVTFLCILKTLCNLLRIRRGCGWRNPFCVDTLVVSCDRAQCAERVADYHKNVISFGWLLRAGPLSRPSHCLVPNKLGILKGSSEALL